MTDIALSRDEVEAVALRLCQEALDDLNDPDTIWLTGAPEVDEETIAHISDVIAHIAKTLRKSEAGHMAPSRTDRLMEKIRGI